MTAPTRTSTRTPARTGLTAAAARFTNRTLKGALQRIDQSWQERAWAFYDTTPEVRFAATWIGNALSGARLFAGRRADDGTIEPAPDDHRATELVSGIAGGPEGQAQLLGNFGPHLTIAGEGWIIIRPSPDAQEGTASHTWHVLSVAEVTQQGGKLTAEIDGVPVIIPALDPDQAADPADPIAIRVWAPHPRRHLEADSPVRSSITLLEELHLLNAAVAAIARSRLTGRGVLLVPKGARFPATPGQDGAEDDLLDVFMTVAETAYREPESAAATVPIILEVPADLIPQIKLITFESNFDELALKLRDEAIRRFATGLEIPAEILLGMGDINHWGVWQLSSEAIRLGIEPKLANVAHALTTQWLRPILQDEGVPDADEWLVWYDTSPLRVRQNRSETAIKVYELGAISDTALRRETGFDDADAPAPGERPAARQAAPAGEGDLPVEETSAPPGTEPATAAAAPPAGGQPGDGLLAAADGLIWGALAAAGEKLLRTPACPRSERGRAKTLQGRVHTLVTVTSQQVEQWRLLDGAWARVPEIAARYRLDPECLTAALDSYCRELIAAGVEHAYEHTGSVLHTSCLAEAA
ncbi:hypothetical protein [Nonomuraea sp. NPDC049646]|uniref:hypothetical protein n=1 Tax=unclassified Nonomuraea TaxID=2593643 RepID=UPI0037A49F8A